MQGMNDTGIGYWLMLILGGIIAGTGLDIMMILWTPFAAWHVYI